jgi:site-specific DNA recombinase
MEAPSALPAAVYNRVSDDRKGRSKSPQEQNTENAAACRGQGWTVRATYTEPESASASRFARKAREEWERCQRDLAAGDIGVLVVWETSRGTRRMAPWVDLLDACRDRGVLIHVTSHDRTYDPRQWRDRKALLEDGIDNEAESEKTSQRVGRAARARAAAGLPNGRLLYGYKREYEYDDTGKRHFLRQLPREDQAAIVREAFRQFTAGESLHAICAGLERRGVPVAFRMNPARRKNPATPRWDEVRLRQMLRNPGYIGKRVYRGKVTGDAAWPAIIDEDTFYLCQRRLEDPSRRMNRGEIHDKHLLSGVARCGVCGAYLRKVPNHTARMIYQCRGRGGDRSKGRYCTSIPAEALETFAEELIIARLSRADARELFTADRTAQAADAGAALLRKQQELDDLYAGVTAGRLSVRALTAIEPALLAEVAALEQAAHSFVPPPLRDVAGPDAAKRWAQLSLDQKKDVMRAIVTIRLHRAGKGGRVGAQKGLTPEIASQRIEIAWKTA